jgi:hypothetical protein
MNLLQAIVIIDAFADESGWDGCFLIKIKSHQ